jgi:glycerol-3-phosphate acyltransferase PlsY
MVLHSLQRGDTVNVYTLLYPLLAYLFGSLPFSHLIAKWQRGLTLREVGEGNVGSRNVWHVVGPGWGVLAGVLDIVKGLVVVLIGAVLPLSLTGRMLAGIAVILGHQFPIFLRGQGGKGVATLGGVLLGITPVSTLAAIALFGLTYLFFRNFNPSIIIAAIAAVILPFFLGQPWQIGAYALVVFLLAGAKKLLDRGHEQAVWQSRPWNDGATPGFQPEEDSDQPHIKDRPVQ